MPENRTLQYGTTKIVYALEYANRKTLGIIVHPDNTVKVTAPLNAKIVDIEKKINTKAHWILKQQAFFLSFHPLTPARKYLSGETHLYLGKQYRLKLIEDSKPSVKLKQGRLYIHTKDVSNTSVVKKQLLKWYKLKAELHFTKIFNKCLPVAAKFSNKTPNLKYLWMTKRWGSCNKSGTVILNLELIKAPKYCIEYVVIHEMCHLLHLNHSQAFYSLLEKHYPNWADTKAYLEKLMV